MSPDTYFSILSVYNFSSCIIIMHVYNIFTSLYYRLSHFDIYAIYIYDFSMILCFYILLHFFDIFLFADNLLVQSLMYLF